MDKKKIEGAIEVLKWFGDKATTVEDRRGTDRLVHRLQTELTAPPEAAVAPEQPASVDTAHKAKRSRKAPVKKAAATKKAPAKAPAKKAPKRAPAKKTTK